MKAPMNAAMMPITMVSQIGMGCLPGTTSRPSAPMMRPMMIAEMIPVMVIDVPSTRGADRLDLPTPGANHPWGGSNTPLGRYVGRRHCWNSDPVITVALVDDYDVVLLGVARMLEGYRDRVRVVEIDANEAVEDVVDVVLYDSFAQPESDQAEVAVLVANPRAQRVVVYTWNFHPELIDSALRQGAHGYL